MRAVIETEVGLQLNYEKAARVEQALLDPVLIRRELMNRSLFEFVKYFWPEVSNDEFIPNWHIPYLCRELEAIAENVGDNKPKLHDLIVNIPPGTTKTKLICVFFPAWCWTNWYWMKFITASYSATLALESAEESRDLIRSARFREIYPELKIKEDKDTKSNYKLIKHKWTDGKGNILEDPIILLGGNRFSTSVGGTVTGFHGHILIWDDPVNPHQAVSETERKTSNRWVDQTLSQRKTNKTVSTTIGVMQRLHEEDPTGHLLKKKKKNLKHICLPGQIRDYREQLQPRELEEFYIDDLLDANRMPWPVLDEMMTDLGQYGYAGQVGQKPTPPSGGMFQPDKMPKLQRAMQDDVNILKVIRYWDKAGSQGQGAYTAGVKMALHRAGHLIIFDIKRGQWGTNIREAIIRSTAEADGKKVTQFVEQEPGSGGKESAEATIRNLMGYTCFADRPTGDKELRADPFSVQVNNGNVWMVEGDWNHLFVEELTNFPNGTYKDQVDAAAAAFNILTGKKQVKGH